jgi:hypothetical protein
VSIWVRKKAPSSAPISVPVPPSSEIPEHAGGDGLHLQPAAGLVGHKANLRGKDNPGAGRQHAVQGKGDHAGAVHRHAQLARGGEVIPTA